MSDLPPGFVLDQPSDLPPGFQVDLPAGFVLDEPAAAPTAAPSTFPARPEFRGSNTRAEPGWGEYLGGIADQAGRGLTEGMVGMVGLPNTIARAGRDVTAWGLDAAGVPPEYTAMLAAVYAPVLGSTPDPAKINAGIDSLNNATADVIGTERPRTEPENTPERYANKIGQFLGGAALPVGGAIATADRIGLEGARTLTGPARSMVEPAAVNAGKFAGKEASVAVAAGAGAQGASDMFPDNGIAEIIGSLAGAGALGAAGVIGKSGKTLFDAITGGTKFQDQVVRDAVVDRLAKAANIQGADVPNAPYNVDPIVQAIDNPQSTRPSAVFPGYQESLADVTRIPGIASLEYGRQQGQNAGMFAGRRMQNNEVVDAAMRNLEPETSPAYLRDALSSERDRRLQEAASGRVSAQDEVARALGLITPDTNPAQRGNTIRSSLTDARTAARDRTNAAYEASDISGRQVPADDLAATVGRAADRPIAEQSYLPQGDMQRIQQLAAVPEGVDVPQVDVEEAIALRRKLRQMRSAALAKPELGGRDAARVLGGALDEVDGFIAKHSTPEEIALLEQAKAAKFDEANRFGRKGDPVFEALDVNEGGVPKIIDANVGKRFLEPQAMDRLFTEADTPEVRSAIRQELLSKGDWTKADRIDQFTSRYGEQLQRFPGLQDELTNAATARRTETLAADRASTLERDLGTDAMPGRGPVGKYLQFSNANSEKAMDEVFAAKDPAKAIDDILAFAGSDPKTLDSARAAMWQKLRKEAQSTDNAQRTMSGARQWRGDWLKSWIDKPQVAAVAERLYKDKPEDLAAIRLYADVLDNVDVRVRGKATATSGTAQGVNPVMTPETLQSRSYAYMRGQISGTYLATSIAAVAARRLMRNARGEAIERMTDQALLDPDFAKQILKENNPANRAALARKAKGWLGPQAASFMEAISDDEDKDIKDAINGR